MFVRGVPGMQQTEKTLVSAKPSRLIVLRYYAAAIFLLILDVILFFQMFGIRLPGLGTYVEPSTVNLVAQLFLLLVAFLLVIRAEIRRYSTRYFVTDYRIIRKDGILRRRETVFPYRQLERVQLSQGIFERMFGIGTIVIDTGDDQMLIESVGDPRKIEQAIMERVQRFQQARY